MTFGDTKIMNPTTTTSRLSIQSPAHTAGSVAEPDRPKRARKPSAAKSGLVSELQAKLREARKIVKATAIVAELSEFGCIEVAKALDNRQQELAPKHT